MKPTFLPFVSICVTLLTCELGLSFTNYFNVIRIANFASCQTRRERNSGDRNKASLNSSISSGGGEDSKKKASKYVLGPKYENKTIEAASNFGTIPPARKPENISQPDGESKTGDKSSGRYDLGIGKNDPFEYRVETNDDSKKMVAKDAKSKYLTRALWLYGGEDKSSAKGRNDNNYTSIESNVVLNLDLENNEQNSLAPELRFEDIDHSIPLDVYDPSNNVDLVWDLLRNDAIREAEREPLLVSFLYSSILNHQSLESALAFHLANRLASPSMISTQIMSLILEALRESPTFGKYLRADLIAVRDRDPACTCLPDVFLHFKGFHALQSQRVAHYLWKQGRKTLGHFFQSQMSQHFQIDIHPNAVLGSGTMLDHGTGLVIGETAVVGHNCSILHHVTLGGSGRRGVDRHPKIGNGVLLGAGATLLGNINVNDGCQVGAGTLVIDDLPPHSVAVGVPAKVIGTYKDADNPSQTMDQVGSEGSDEIISYFLTDGI